MILNIWMSRVMSLLLSFPLPRSAIRCFLFAAPCVFLYQTLDETRIATLPSARRMVERITKALGTPEPFAKTRTEYFRELRKAS
jgi:hypothetical protein